MIELIIEHWKNPTEEHFLWSVWHDGTRVQMGGPRDDADAAEADGARWCAATLKRPPDRVTRL